MNYLNKFKLHILSALIILSSALIFTGCGKVYKVNVSAEVPEGYSVSQGEEIKANKSYELYINAEPGYSLDGIVVKINNTTVKGVVKTNADDQDIIVSDKTAIDHGRVWNYTINKVSSDTNIIIDFSNCGLIDCTVTLSNLENQNAMYATYIGPEEHSGTVFNSLLISQPKAVVNNQASVKYGESLYILLDKNINLLKSNSDGYTYCPPLTKYADEHYQYNNKFVYFFNYVTNDFTITESIENNQDYIYTTEKLATIAFKGTGSDAVNFEYYGGGLNSEPTGALSGSGLFYHSYIYLGDKNNFENEQIENNLIDEYLRLMGKKAYYRLYLNPSFYNSDINVKHVANFYLVENIYQDTTNLSPLTIKEDDISEYLEIEKSDIEQYISNETAGLYLKTVIHNDILKNDFFGLKLNYLNDDRNTGVKIVSEYDTHNPSYYEFLEDKKITYYFHKSQLYTNQIQNDLSISFGKIYSNFGDMPYVDSTEFKVSRSNNIEAIYSKKFDYAPNSVYVGDEVLKNHGLDLIGGFKNMFEITIQTTYQSKDISTHKIDFSEFFNSDYQATKSFFISTSVTNPEWVEFTEANLSKLNNLTISTINPLYVYSLDHSYFPFDLYSSDTELVSRYSLATDIRGKAISTNKNDNSYNVYALTLDKLYLPNETQLHADMASIDG